MRVRVRSRQQIYSGNDLNRWTVSFADFMTLMFAVFVVLFAVSSSKEEKFKDVIQSIQEASKLLEKSVFETKPEALLINESETLIGDSDPTIFTEQEVRQAGNELSDVATLKQGEQLGLLKLELEKALLPELNNKSVKLALDGDWLTIEMGGGILFIGGSHTLLNSAKQQIEKLVSVLKPVNNLLRIRGYTDTEVISNEIYKSNWELAGARASTVLHALSKYGILGQRMVMESHGQYAPVIDSKGNVDRLKSRRVVIAISKYALAKEVVKNENQEIKSEKNNLPIVDIAKPDREEMYELRLPENRLIITTRQE